MSGSAWDDIPASVMQEWKGLRNLEHPPKHVQAIIPLTVILSVLVVAIVGARAWVRVKVQRSVDASDWIIFICTVRESSSPRSE